MDQEDISGTPVGILQVALRKEQAAYNFYDRMLKKTKVKMLNDVLLELREGEAQHVEMIQKKLAKFRMG